MKSTVGYLTMAFLRRNWHHAICNTLDQIYPDELKTLYMLYQRGADGQFPSHIKYEAPFRIVQENVEGHWPQLWWEKLNRFCKLTNTDISIIWDEDDRYPPLYTMRMVEELEANPDRGVAWTLNNYSAKRDSFKSFRHECPIGCAVFRTEFLKVMVANIVREYPKKFSDGQKHNKVQKAQPTPENPTRLSWGALDNQMCRRIEAKHRDKIIIVDPASADVRVQIQGGLPRMVETTTGKRTYAQHSNQNSVKKNPVEDID